MSGVLGWKVLWPTTPDLSILLYNNIEGKLYFEYDTVGSSWTTSSEATIIVEFDFLENAKSLKFGLNTYIKQMEKHLFKKMN